MNLGESFSMTTLGGIAEEDGYSDSLLKAVIDRLGSDDESDLMDECESTTISSVWIYVLTAHTDAVLSRENAIPWVGVVLLQSQCASAEGTPTSRFLQEWQNQLPESWREQATLEVLKV